MAIPKNLAGFRVRSLWTLTCHKLHSIFVAYYMQKGDRLMFTARPKRTHPKRNR